MEDLFKKFGDDDVSVVDHVSPEYKELINWKAMKDICHNLQLNYERNSVRRRIEVKMDALDASRKEKMATFSDWKYRQRRSSDSSKSTSDFSESTSESQDSSDSSNRLILQDTKWCGKGNVSRVYDDLGNNARTDKCCREHDHCPRTIEGFSYKYNLFNYRFHTLSWCECDDQ